MGTHDLILFFRKAEFERLNIDAARAVQLLATQASEKAVPGVEDRATMTIDDRRCDGVLAGGDLQSR